MGAAHSAVLPQQDCYVNVLRDAMAVDALEDCGILFRHHRAAGLLLARRRRHVERHRARFAQGALRGGADAALKRADAMSAAATIRIILPYHLRISRV
jgi:hypothetical protein